MDKNTKERVAGALFGGDDLRKTSKKAGFSYHTLMRRLAESDIEVRKVLVERSTGKILLPSGVSASEIA